MIVDAHIERIEPQIDGRRYVTEIQTDDATGDLRFVYLADGDPNPIMNARTAAMNAALAAIPTVTITEDDGTTNTLRTGDIANTSLQLTAGQKSALQTAKAVILAVKPFLRVYQTLTSAQQQFVLAHSPWIQQAIDVIYGG